MAHILKKVLRGIGSKPSKGRSFVCFIFNGAKDSTIYSIFQNWKVMINKE